MSKNILKIKEREPVIIDATNHKIGRLASIIAKKLLNGERVIIVNAEKAIITGNKKAILERYLMLRRRRQFTSHKKITVWFPIRPDRILKYAIIRMLPRKKDKGRKAAKRLKVYIGLPKEYSKMNIQKIDEAEFKSRYSSSGKMINYITIEELSKELGWKGIE